jgi:molybdate transport system regulatory protein
VAKLSIRVDFSNDSQLGPGKARLLELIGETGSISAAGRALKMSYRRAWLLVDALNHIFKEPVVTTSMGGKAGGGARLTPLGREVVRHYRGLEARAAAATKSHLVPLEAALALARADAKPLKPDTDAAE